MRTIDKLVVDDHELIPLPSGPLALTPAQTDSILRELSCLICYEMPTVGRDWLESPVLETPCCSRVVHRDCVMKTTTSSSKGDNKEKKHVRRGRPRATPDAGIAGTI